MKIGRNWFMAVSLLVLLAQELLPFVPVPDEWHGFIDKLPAALTLALVRLGWTAYDKDREGNSLNPPQEPPRS